MVELLGFARASSLELERRLGSVQPLGGVPARSSNAPIWADCSLALPELCTLNTEYGYTEISVSRLRNTVCCTQSNKQGGPTLLYSRKSIQRKQINRSENSDVSPDLQFPVHLLPQPYIEIYPPYHFAEKTCHAPRRPVCLDGCNCNAFKEQELETNCPPCLGHELHHNPAGGCPAKEAPI